MEKAHTRKKVGFMMHVSVEPCMPGEFLGFESGGPVLISRRRVLL